MLSKQSKTFLNSNIGTDSEIKEWNLGNISVCREMIFGISTCWLMLFHSVGIDFTKSALIPSILARGLNVIKNSGNIGVDIFLIMSGIGLYFSLSKEKDLKEYYIRRIKRIIPTVIVCSTIWFGISNVGTLKTYLVYISLGGVYLYGESYFWFFSLLIPLYAIYPVYRKMQDKLRGDTILGISTIVGWTIILLLIIKTEFFYRTEIALTRVPAFIVGCMMGKPIKENRTISRLVTVLYTLALVPLIMLYNSELTTLIQRYIGTVCAIIAVFLFTDIFVRIRKQRIIRVPLEIIGNYSMELYLLYSAVGILCKDVFNVRSDTGIAYYIPVTTVTFVFAIGLKATTSKIVSLIEITANRH